MSLPLLVAMLQDRLPESQAHEIVSERLEGNNRDTNYSYGNFPKTFLKIINVKRKLSLKLVDWVQM